MTPLLWVILIAEIVLVLGIGTWVVLHAGIRQRRERRRAGPEQAALDALAIAATGGASARADAASVLRKIPTDIRLEAVVRTANIVSGSAREDLAEVASDVGIRTDAFELLESGHWWKRALGARVLMGLGMPPQLNLLDDPSMEVRQVGAAWVVSRPDNESIHLLIDMVGSGSTLLRFVAQDALVEIGSGATVQVAAALQDLIMKPDVRPDRVVSLIEVAAGISDPELAEAVVPLSHHPADVIRAAAISALAHAGGSQNEHRVAEALVDPAPEVRAAAAGALGDMAAWREGVAVVRLLEDPDAETAREAAVALGSMGPVGRVLLRQAVMSGGDGGRLAAQVLNGHTGSFVSAA